MARQPSAHFLGCFCFNGLCKAGYPRHDHLGPDPEDEGDRRSEPPACGDGWRVRSRAEEFSRQNGKEDSMYCPYHHLRRLVSSDCTGVPAPAPEQLEKKTMALSEGWLATTDPGVPHSTQNLRDAFSPRKPIFWLTEDGGRKARDWRRKPSGGRPFSQPSRYLDQLGRLRRAGVQGFVMHNTALTADYGLLGRGPTADTEGPITGGALASCAK